MTRREVQVVTALVRHHETKPVPVAADRPGHQVEALDQAVLPPPVADDLPGADHFAQLVIQTGLQSGAGEVERLRNGLDTRRPPCFFKKIKDF